MGRTPNSLAMKLCNFASLDPVQQARGVRGLPGATRQDREMWNEFQSNLLMLGPESEQMLHDMFTRDKRRKSTCFHEKKFASFRLQDRQKLKRL
jgi:hypothetical protein